MHGMWLCAMLPEKRMHIYLLLENRVNARILYYAIILWQWNRKNAPQVMREWEWKTIFGPWKLFHNMQTHTHTNLHIPERTNARFARASSCTMYLCIWLYQPGWMAVKLSSSESTHFDASVHCMGNTLLSNWMNWPQGFSAL